MPTASTCSGKAAKGRVPARTIVKDTLLRRLHLTATRLRFHLFQRRRARRPILEQVAGYPIVVPPQVFNPRWFYSGDFLARTLNAGMITPVKEGQRVLDMGTGSGVVAVVAASLGARVVAVDVNPHAVRAARLNALLNDVEPSVDVREGDLFEPVVGEQFDLVVFNPPYLSGAPQTPFEQALYNTGVVERFSAGLATYLTPGGSGLVLLSTLADEASFLRCFAADGFSRSSVAEERLLAETLTLYRLIPQEARE